MRFSYQNTAGFTVVSAIPDGTVHTETVSASGTSSGGAAQLPYSGNHVTLTEITGVSSTSSGVILPSGAPVGAISKLFTTSTTNAIVYGPSGRLFPSDGQTFAAGMVAFEKVNDTDWWRVS